MFLSCSKFLCCGVLLCSVVGGCTQGHRPASPAADLRQSDAWQDNASQDESAEPAREQVAAAALVFDAPAAADPIFLSRADRQPGAFFGYDEGSIEYYRLTVDDQQIGLGGGGWGGRGGGGGLGRGGSSGWYDRYERRSYSERVGSIRR